MLPERIRRQNRCKKCGELGHAQKTCGRPVVVPGTPGRYSTTGRTMVCTNCGIAGHNRMTCTSPKNPDYVPPRYQSQHSGRSRCNRCGEATHTVATCTNAEVVHPGRICKGCGVVRERTNHGELEWRCRPCMTRERAVKPRPCIVCGVEMVGRLSRIKVCSEPCRRKRISDRHKGRFDSLESVRFGLWTVVEHTIAEKCVCRCECGAVQAIRSDVLRGGDSLGCKRCVPRTRLAMMADEERKARDAALQRLSDAEYEARKGAVYRREVRGEGWIADVKRQVNALKESTPCMDCKGKFSAVAMDFDHRPGETKVGDVSKFTKWGKSVDALFAEIAKCDLVCSNCHRVRTFKRGQHGP